MEFEEEKEKKGGGLEIVFQDEYFIAINKPNGLLVHKTKIAEEKKEFALQKVRDQIGKFVYTVHRIDRPTSGILLFSLSQEAQRAARTLFDERTIKKTYWALVRGHTEEEGVIDHPLKRIESKSKGAQEAVTKYQTLKRVEMPYSISRYPNSRYSLVLAEPETGRTHQIRRHFAHIRHYIIGDKRHGECKHNRYFSDVLELKYLFLHAKKLNFIHPFTKENIEIKSRLPEHWTTIFNKFNRSDVLNEEAKI